MKSIYIFDTEAFDTEITMGLPLPDWIDGLQSNYSLKPLSFDQKTNKPRNKQKKNDRDLDKKCKGLISDTVRRMAVRRSGKSTTNKCC